LSDVLIPALGEVIFQYTYKEAAADGVVVSFELRNVVFEMEEQRQAEYERLTGAIARSIKRNGIEASETIALLLKRARVLNLSMNRVRIALKLIAANRARRTIVFHEDIEACELIHHVLKENGVQSGVYHSGLSLKERARTLKAFRLGEIEVLVTCRALDEGFNVPEAEMGIIAASTATRRQRIQRLGRVLRPSSGKSKAIVYTLVATAPEIGRLKEEEALLEGVSEITWVNA
jgi:superfamily II DNA or RNA helicase